MSLTQRYENPIIITDLVPLNYKVHLLDETAGTTPDGWDSLDRRMALLGTSEQTIESLNETFPVGAKVGPRNLFVQSISNFKCHGGFLYSFVVHYKGISSFKPIIQDMDAAADQQQGTNILTPDGLFEAVATHEATPTVSVRYVTESSDFVNQTQSVGRSQVPPSPPQVSPSVWDSLSKFTYHWPNGWVLMSSKLTHLPGTRLALVDDRYQFIRAFTPRS